MYSELLKAFQSNKNCSFYTDDECHEIKPGEIMTACGHVRSGYECPENKFVVISENDIFGQKRLRKKKKKGLKSDPR